MVRHGPLPWYPVARLLADALRSFGTTRIVDLHAAGGCPSSATNRYWDQALGAQATRQPHRQVPETWIPFGRPPHTFRLRPTSRLSRSIPQRCSRQSSGAGPSLRPFTTSRPGRLVETLPMRCRGTSESAISSLPIAGCWQKPCPNYRHRRSRCVGSIDSASVSHGYPRGRRNPASVSPEMGKGRSGPPLFPVDVSLLSQNPSKVSLSV